MQAIIDGIESGFIPAKIAVVISSREDAYGLKRAEAHGLETCYIGAGNYPDPNLRTEKILDVLRKKQIDLVVLAGYMSILDQIVEAYRNQIINIHPSLIPSFCGKGFYGKRVHQAVLDYGAKVTGATVHFVEEGTDTGPIILQKAVEVKENDTAETLAQRVLVVEHELLPLAVKLFAEGRLHVEGRESR